ncbi:5-deoxy-glucuronate isomerase [Kitasatospora sp. NPDC088346]|uniref:5-deoxy-glucuronate isomerase n=1 Tax=Kitasatospora sp. NPDC088346 TaxID=3364073 RepID=UPI003827C684
MPADAPGPGPVRLHLPDGSATRDGYRCRIDTATAGWTYTSLRILDLAPGASRTFDTGDSEWIVLPLSGACRVACDGRTLDLHGRPDVFRAVSDFAYLPRDSTATVTSAAGGRFALTGARCERRLAFRHGPADEVPVEIRGTGSNSRQVNNFAGVDAFDTDRLIAVEVLTPAGNWSSYPPHRHDRERPGVESRLEEIYWFTIADSPAGTPGSGYHRVYPSGDRTRSDLLAEVRTGDAVLVPDGYHGPSMAAPGYDMYYLNAMAGPGATRAWLICDDPAHSWVRQTWIGQAADPRLPLYTAPARGASAPAPAPTEGPER